MNALGKKCFRLLCDICATRGVLPTQYTLNPSDLQCPVGEPVASGGFGSVWKGEYKGMVVAIKKLKVTQQEIPKKVYHLTKTECTISEIRNRAFAMK